ncbi:DNA polymerase alpha accessory factor Mcl1 [Schizosaccharomyces cryophilus OY26]|uniref:DNA polymerase alpha accessory factor Mcl1 n=1 Tax=Schizosaccharomyces cryophilus (strain OY26 / ATCC MYA-4695 / CBS 11777 / NBRC 106824 / NRRL Y48691) TaxID=653667 RepID=S9VWW6_SCHCR|nr:DNA polymerase alpha accessory factor Mcl1 [Schizosaccharomyces cryophilus OY26]EPY52148.1 DNA polymerase alpha accessory factor Mcl1 [Schizosaccharomyces cryophilus OY26]
MAGNRLVPRYAHTDGLTRLAYTVDGTFLLTVGSNLVIRKFQVGSDEEPESIDNHQDPITGIAVSKTHFCTCSEDATICIYPINNSSEHTLLARTTLPVRDIAYSIDGDWIAIASDETAVKLVNTKEPTQIHSLRPSKTSNKHVSFSPNEKFLAISSCNGILYFYDNQSRSLLKFLTNTILSVEGDSDLTSKAIWHPSDGTFAVANSENQVAILSTDDWLALYKLTPKENYSSITDIAWSSNGRFLAASFRDKGILIWDTLSKEIVSEHHYSNVVALAWQPFANVLSFTTNQGVLYNCPEVIPFSGSITEADFQKSTQLTNGHKKRVILDEDEEELYRNQNTNENAAAAADITNGEEDFGDFNENALDDPLDLDGDSYMVNEDELEVAKKRKARPIHGHQPVSFEDGARKRRLLQFAVHKPVYAGSTPWQGNRRYLCLNLVGCIWTVQQDDGHNTITVEFHDESNHRKYHFPDDQRFELACLDEEGALFSAPATEQSPGVIYYKPHVDWSRRSEWALMLPMEDESPISIALSSSVVVVCTTSGYVRIYSRTGFPISIYRSKQLPFVACSAYKDLVLIVANGGAAADGTPQLVYTIEDISKNYVYQSNDGLALPPAGELLSIFFSDVGDPYMYDSDGVLLALLHWRTPGQAKWVPVLDTNELERRKSRQESYWPVTVADNQFHCILLKGSARYPYFPRPMFTEFPFRIPCTVMTPDAPTSVPSLEELQLRNVILLTLTEEAIDEGNVSQEQQLQVTKLEANIDKALLQLIQKACTEEKLERVLELTKSLRRTPSILAAQKIALHHSLTQIAEKIGTLLPAA